MDPAGFGGQGEEQPPRRRAVEVVDARRIFRRRLAARPVEGEEDGPSGAERPEQTAVDQQLTGTPAAQAPMNIIFFEFCYFMK